MLSAYGHALGTDRSTGSLVDAAAVIRHARKLVASELQIRIRLVVAKQDGCSAALAP